MDLPTHLTAEPEDIELEQTPSSPKLDPSAEGVVNKLNDDQWSEDVWARNILKYNPVQGSKDKLQKRLAGFLQHATEAERNAVDETREKLSKTLETALLAQSKRYPDQDGAGIRASLSANMKKGWARTSEVAYQYAQMLDVMVGQAPEFVGLVYGAVKIIIVVQVNYEETKQKMEKYLNEISSKFGLVDHLVAYIPTARLVAALGQAYSLFTLFLAKAVKFYTQNRRRLYLKALSKPWDRLQVFVDGINQALLEANDIAQFHGLITTHANLMVSQETLAVVRKNETGIMQTQARVERLLSQVEAITIYFSKKKDMQETANLVQQQAMEMLENPFQDQSKPLASEDSRSHSQSQPNSGAGATETNPEEDPVDRLRQDIFVELQDHLEHLGARKRAVEQFPDMGPHRSKQRNLLRSEKFMDWVESQTSQLLWVDANHVVSRPDFNASFAIPLLLVGESKYESVVVLRHFIAETGTTKRHHALVQSLLLQIFEQNPTVYQKKRGSITREDSSNLERLWNIFKDCMQQVDTDCVFIMIDNFDSLGSDGSDNDGQASITIEHLHSLIKEQDKKLIKILLSSHLTHHDVASTQSQSSVMNLTSTQGPQRRLSLACLEDQLPLVSHRMMELKETKDKTVRFENLPLLYLPGTTIYKQEQDGTTQAYAVAELSGMAPRPFGFDPLHIHAWSVDHNGRYFTKKYHDFRVSQFSGRRAIAALTYVPSGYVRGENELRRELVSRGRKYWALGSQPSHREFQGKVRPIRAVIDQCRRPLPEPRPAQEFEDQFRPTGVERLKPRTLMLCPPVIDAYALAELSWTTHKVQDIREIDWSPDPFRRIPRLQKSHVKILKNIAHSLSADNDNTQAMDFPATPVASTTPTITTSSTSRTILLHGPNGTGKSLAISCTAEYARRPLFMLSSVHLGNSARQVHEIVINVFKLADAWGAMVVLDDADLYLFKRRNDASIDNNVVSNGMMHAREFFSGYLFLTTTHADLLDEGVMSRIGVKLYLPTLSDEEVLLVFSLFLEDLPTTLGGLPVEFDKELIMRYAKHDKEASHFMNRRSVKAWVDEALRQAQGNAKTKNATRIYLTPDEFKQAKGLII